MSEEQKKRDNLTKEEIEKRLAPPYDKTPVNFSVAITAEQKAMVIKLCEFVIKSNIEIMAYGKTYYCKQCHNSHNEKDMINHLLGCDVRLAKQLKEELK